MEAKEIIKLSLERSEEFLTSALKDLSQQEFAWSPGPESNSMAFIMWHQARVEDFFVNRVIRGQVELYEAQGFRDRLGTPPKDTGNSYTVEKLRAWQAPPMETLVAYHQAVRQATLDLLETVTPQKLDEVPKPDRSPESVGIMLMRVITEAAHHVGQMSYLRGMQRGLNK